jgi:hypothetical protein
MMAPHAPVQARTTEWAPAAHERRHVDAHCGEELLARRRQRRLAVAETQQALPLQAFVNEHSELTSEMVVAHARLAQCWLARSWHSNPRRCAQRARARSHACQRFEDLRDIVIGQTVVAMSPLALY